MNTSPHRWQYLDRKHVLPSVLVLDRARTTRELDAVSRVSVEVRGTLAECRACGCLALWGHHVDEAGQRQDVSLFGVDLESMTPSRTPRCESLSREVA